MILPQLMVCGYGRHGKDTFCELAEDYGYHFVSSSYFCADKVIMNTEWGKSRYSTADEAFEDRHNHRQKWYDIISEYNAIDPSALSRAIYSDYDIYCGIRNKEEFIAAKFHDLFDLSIWVDASERCEIEVGSCTITKDMCDIVIENNGTLKEFTSKSQSLLEVLTNSVYR